MESEIRYGWTYTSWERAGLQFGRVHWSLVWLALQAIVIVRHIVAQLWLWVLIQSQSARFSTIYLCFCLAYRMCKMCLPTTHLISNSPLLPRLLIINLFILNNVKFYPDSNCINTILFTFGVCFYCRKTLWLSNG